MKGMMSRVCLINDCERRRRIEGRESEREIERERKCVCVRDGSKQITAAVRTLFIHSFCLYTDVFTKDEGVK